MRLTQTQAVARPDYYDRNLVSRGQGYSGASVAPHAATQRWTYTVPTGKKAYIGHLQLLLERMTAAAPGGLAEAYWFLDPTDAAGRNILHVLTNTNTVGDSRHAVASPSLVIEAGDILTGYTQDLSVGGTYLYVLTCSYVEFDA